MNTLISHRLQQELQPRGGSRVSEPTDHQLVALAQGGDMDALGKLYDRYHQDIYRFLLSRLNNQYLAEDMTGEVFLRMLSGLGDYHSSQQVPFRAWLYRIARNLLIDHYRKEGGRSVGSLSETLRYSNHSDNLDTAMEKKLTLQQVQQALIALDEIQRDVIVLRFLAGLSAKDVADVLGKSVAAVKAIQHRGLLSLQTVLAQHQE